ncbi:MAG: type II toxin-antitoxin system HicA family toxin [Kiritimatiellia bacterium]
MPRLPRLDAAGAEKLLLRSGFVWMRGKGSHRIYFRAGIRVVLPFHAGRELHPKIVRQVLDAIGEEPDQKP